MYMSKFVIGEHYSSNRYGTYVINEELAGRRYRITFDKTGYSNTYHYATLLGGNVRDPYYPIYYGIACQG